MAQIVAEKGYREVTVRELAQRAGVSSRAFYQHYSSKEECFLSTHESIVRRIARRIIAAQAGEEGWQERLEVTFESFLEELHQDPLAARLILVEAYVAGSLALDQVRAAERTFEMRIAECFESETHELSFPPQLARGIVAGMMCVSRFRLFDDQKPSLAQLAEELTSWSVSILTAISVDTGKLQAEAAHFPTSEDLEASSSLDHSRTTTANSYDLIVAALTKLAANEGYEAMTVRKVRTSAGASSRKFNLHFNGIADCFQQAVDIYVGNIAALLDADESEGSPVAQLCESVAGDSALATLCFVDIFSPGGEIGLQSLKQLTATISNLLASSTQTPTESEASAGAIWGSIREEVICGRGAQLPKLIPALDLLAPAPAHDPSFHDKPEFIAVRA